MLNQIESYNKKFPKTVELFGNILKTYISQHPFLEDWLIIPHYQFFWNNDLAALAWFEGLFEKSILLFGNSSWESRLEESIIRTNCKTTNTLLDRLYDIQLELYGALYLANHGWVINFIPRSNTEKRPDIKATRANQECVLECKFIHSSEKYASFFRRFNSMIHQYNTSHFAYILAEQCQFPSALKLKEIKPEDCLAVKIFLSNILHDHEATHNCYFKKLQFTYSYLLQANCVTIDKQYDFAKNQGHKFATEYLSRQLENAASQLIKPEFSHCKKILFIGLQPDDLYLAPWNEPVIPYLKSVFAPVAATKNISVIFSEDVGHSARGYV